MTSIMDETERRRLEKEAMRLKSIAEARVQDFRETVEEFTKSPTEGKSRQLMTEAGRMQKAFFEYTPVLEELLGFYRQYFLEHQ